MLENGIGEIPHDLVRLGLPMDSPVGADVNEWRYTELFWLVNATSKISHRQREQALATKPAVLTSIGKQVLDFLYAEDFIEFEAVETADCCSDAELRLLANISQENVSNDKLGSPVILTDGHTAAGIIKNYGEKSCYGLADATSYGIVKGAFCAPKTWETVYAMQELEPSAHAWYVPIESLNGFAPRRLSSFCVALSERADLLPNTQYPDEKDVLTTAHEAISEQVAKLLETAKPVPPSVLNEARLLAHSSV